MSTFSVPILLHLHWRLHCLHWTVDPLHSYNNGNATNIQCWTQWIIYIYYISFLSVLHIFLNINISCGIVAMHSFFIIKLVPIFDHAWHLAPTSRPRVQLPLHHQHRLYGPSHGLIAKGPLVTKFCLLLSYLYLLYYVNDE